MEAYRGACRRSAVTSSQVASNNKCRLVESPDLFATVGESLSVFRRHYGAAAPLVPYTANASLGPSLTARRDISSQNSLQASVSVFSDGTMAYQHSHAEPGLVSVFSDGTMMHASTAAAEGSCPLLLGKKHTAATP